MNADTPISALTRRLASDLGSETIVLDADAGTYWSLNPVGARVWALVQEPTTFGAVVETLLGEYDVDRARCEREVAALVRQMHDYDLVRVGT